MNRAAIGLLLTALAGVWGSPVRSTAAESPPRITTRQAKVKITVGKDTTYITGPLNADGTVNYVAYINAKHSKGVTPRNNAGIGTFQQVS